ncbi:MAG: UDP-N-acetylmuramate:L-alanyl-gamma-D-glutamyl-meso-diaminopimelate ligase [Gammaproteobacteria bacterium]
MNIHVAGICGTFMAGLAHIARAAGHHVTGSDRNVYPPMSDFLREAGIRVHEGWDQAALPADTELVVIGNALSRGNPLVEAVLDRGLRYTSGAQWIAEHVLHGREVIAVAGTHGKTTTTAMIAWILECAGLAPGFLVGGIPQDFAVPARLGAGRHFVIEADEYDTAFFDKRSKFVHYRPTLALLNNLEYDHADIFPDLAAIQTQFHHLLRTVPARGTVLWQAQDANLAAVIARGCWSRQLRFGEDAGDWQLEETADGGYAVVPPDGAAQALRLALPGRHNALNAVAALAAAATAGVSLAMALDALARFGGVKRRLELRGNVAGIAVYDDFAHHPTAVAATIAALKRRLHDGRVIAVLEPRSNTMRAGVHHEALGASLAAADVVWLYEPPNLGWRAGEAIAELGARAHVATSVTAIVEALVASLVAGDHVLVMSNGGFEQIHARLLAALAARHQAAEQ